MARKSTHDTAVAAEPTGARVRPESLMTKDDLGKLFHIKKPTVNAWIRENRIEYVKVGRSILFRPESVAALIDKNTYAPAQ